jgi:hypothetical protein
MPRSTGRYELRFPGLFSAGRGYAFPCDAEGRVDIDTLSDSGRANYFYARTVVGRELSMPCTCPIGEPVELGSRDALPRKPPCE